MSFNINILIVNLLVFARNENLTETRPRLILNSPTQPSKPTFFFFLFKIRFSMSNDNIKITNHGVRFSKQGTECRVAYEEVAFDIHA